MIDRRQLLRSAPLLAAALPLPGLLRAQQETATAATLRPRRLQPGDTIGLVAPSGAIYERAPYELAHEALKALGFKVREGAHLRARHGHLAGTDEQRAGDVNAMFADPAVHGILAMIGGAGGARMLSRVDYGLVRRQPKFLGGYSDLTALVNAVHARSGLITFHSPMAASDWNEFSTAQFRATVMAAEAVLMRNPVPAGDSLVPREGRIEVLRGGRARGRLVGGNLAVLVGLAGSPYWPRFDGALLFLEEANEYIYRVDRMFSTLELSGALARVAGVVLGGFTNCGPGDGKHGSLTLDEVFDRFLLPLDVPVYRGASFGHIRRKFTLPVGGLAEMDADAGTLRLLEPVVA
jgi:muramoyltetrapeptide carboxypeptidase